MSSIKADGRLRGCISGKGELNGKLTKIGGLSGKLSIDINHNVYSGTYEVTPSAVAEKTLPTADKILKNDVVIHKIPYYETSNHQDGLTVYIAEEV